MDSAKLILTEPVSPPTPLNRLDRPDFNNIPEERKKQIAKDFESVLLSKMLDQMKNTIGDWGFEKDGASNQVQGIFWMFLSRDIANNGGIGLWKDIYQLLNNTNSANTAGKSVNGQI